MRNVVKTWLLIMDYIKLHSKLCSARIRKTRKCHSKLYMPRDLNCTCKYKMYLNVDDNKKPDDLKFEQKHTEKYYNKVISLILNLKQNLSSNCLFNDLTPMHEIEQIDNS